MISDNDFVNWMNIPLNENIHNIDKNKNYMFYGYYQHDNIYKTLNLIGLLKKNCNSFKYLDISKNNQNIMF